MPDCYAAKMISANRAFLSKHVIEKVRVIQSIRETLITCFTVTMSIMPPCATYTDNVLLKRGLVPIISRHAMARMSV